MNALKYLPVIAALMLSPTLHAAEVFVSHYEPLHNMTTHAVDSTSANGSQKLQREAPAVLSFEALGRSFDLNLEANLAVHFHNTRGLGLANCLAAYEAGVRIFDTAIGGLSGTPFGAPKMKVGCWNVPTEDLVYLFNEIGVNTGINLDALLDSVKLARKMAGRELFGHVLKARAVFEVSNFPEPLKIH